MTTSTIDNPINSLDVTVATPDEKAYGRVRGRREVSVWFAPGYYDAATESDLQRQLTRLGRLLFAARMREYYRLRSLAFRRTVTKESPPATDRDREFVGRRDELVAEGSSPDGQIRVSAVGMQNWTVSIEPGLSRTRDEQSFLADLATAANALVDDQFAKIRELKYDVYA